MGDNEEDSMLLRLMNAVDTLTKQVQTLNDRLTALEMDTDPLDASRLQAVENASRDMAQQLALKWGGSLADVWNFD